MTRHVLQIRCPCCRKPIEVDTRTGKARAQAGPESGLDALLDAHRNESERLDALFDAARDGHASEAERREDAFRRAAKEAKDDKSKPRTPFDLD
ncbi:MAG: hypothetical protein ACO4CZ_16130 [Planctomycetota bacterium]